MADKVGELREALYRAAKANPNRRFYSLFDKVCRMDVLEEAWKLVRTNQGAPGTDDITIEEFQKDQSSNLEAIAKELREQKYVATPARRVWIPKSNGKKRGLGIPTVKDRIVQQAVKIVIEPIFEAGFMECSFGFRPNKSAHDAVDEIVNYLNFGYEHVIDADITGCFDNIPKSILMQNVAARISDGRTLKLVKSFLNAGIMEGDIVTNTEIGTPQGSPLSPLFANIYLNNLDMAWVSGKHTTETHIIRYADDFLILGKGDMEPEMQTLSGIMEQLKLDLNREKTRHTKAESGFDFLGFHFVRHYSRKQSKRVTRWFPSKKSGKVIRKKISEKTGRKALSTVTPYEALEDVKTILRGWSNYFRHSMCGTAFVSIWTYTDKRIGYMHSRWKQRERIGRYGNLKRLGLILPPPPSQDIYRRYNAVRRSSSVSVVREIRPPRLTRV